MGFEDADDDKSDDEKENDFFNIEEKDVNDEKPVEDTSDKASDNGVAASMQSLKLSAAAAEWVPKTKAWNNFENSDMKWIKNDQVFSAPESRYEVKTVDITVNYWEYNAEKSFYQML